MSCARAEAAHRLLERIRRAVRVEHDRFAVEDRGARGKLARELDDLRRGRRDVVARARVDAHVVPVLVHLHARAVELPFDRRLAADARHRVVDVVGGLREHRRERLEQRDAVARTALRRPARIAVRGHRGDAAAGHRRPPHAGGRHVGSGGDGVDHQAFERALPQLADQQAREEVGLARRRACEELGRAASPCAWPIPRRWSSRSARAPHRRRASASAGVAACAAGRVSRNIA